MNASAITMSYRAVLGRPLAIAAMTLALLAVPGVVQAQGVFRGMERGANQGAYEGNRAAGPVGGAVGGAIGAGVGGVVGGVKGVLGIPDRGPYRGKRCRGYYDRHHHFHCYRR
ncbi:MAG: hypothetical protein WBA29_04255 [Xanthobacteraceae bacterium]